MRLRVMDFGLQPALRSQAVYHGLAETIDADSDPILSLISPETPYVCIGMHQDLNKEVDTAYCADEGLPVYRRHVGGGAVYLDRHQLFTHFIYPRRKAPEFAVNLYPRFIEPVLRTYRDFGIDAVFRPINDIHVGGRKIGGTGAAAIGEATVMVGSFMFDFDTERMARCLKVPSEKFRDKLHQSLRDYITTMTRELGSPPAREAVIERFLGHCATVLGVTPEPDRPDAAEHAAIERAEHTLADPAWTRRPGRPRLSAGVKIAHGTHLGEGSHKAAGGLIRTRLLEHEGHVADLEISGDFTCLPPEGIGHLVAALTGVPLDPAALARRAGETLAGGIDMPGVTADDLAAAVLAARRTD